MEAMTENTIRQEQIESMGRLMAGFAHDMKNHLGIIRESNGLMDDIIAMGALGEDEPAVERLKKSIAAIERRVVISANMLHHLSGLAHRPDTAHSSFLVNALIEEEYTFLERFSRLRQIGVEFEFGETLSTVYNDPALLQHVFYRVYSLCLEQMESGAELTVITEQEKQVAVIRFRFLRTSQMNFEKLSDNSLQAAVEKLNGELKLGDNETNNVDIRLAISSLSTDGTP
jgi:C4-dicarboxylate-specific signal transduction histidine kinase